MNEKLRLIRLPILLLVLFCAGKVVVGALGGSYELGNRLFAMVPLTVNLCLIWGALSRRYHGYKLGGAALTGVLIALVAQILIFGMTLISYAAGMDTHFSNSMALVNEIRPVEFGEAMGARAGGLVVNAIIGAVMASIGYAMAGLLPGRRKSD